MAGRDCTELSGESRIPGFLALLSTPTRKITDAVVFLPSENFITNFTALYLFRAELTNYCPDLYGPKIKIVFIEQVLAPYFYGTSLFSVSQNILQKQTATFLTYLFQRKILFKRCL
jgi:hypothetical protein